MDEEMKQEVVDFLVQKGAVSPHSVDSDGDIIYRFDMRVLKDVMPSLYDIIMEDLDNDLMGLYKKGLLDIEYDENLEASFRISALGYKYLETGELPESEFDDE